VLHVALVLLTALSVSSDPPAPNELPRLDLARLYVANGTGIRVAPEVEALAGHRVRVVGYLAKMEDYVPHGAVYLTRLPVEAEEGGGGTGDLPPGALRVEVPRLAGEEIEFVPGAVEVIGTLQVGRAEDEEGRVSWLRVVVDDPPGTTKAVR
jgi:hypothetical protein